MSERGGSTALENRSADTPESNNPARVRAARDITAAIYGALHGHSDGPSLAATLREAAGASLAVVARPHNGTLVCDDCAGAGSLRISPGDTVPLRAYPASGDDPGYAFLVRERRAEEPLGEYLVLTGYHDVVVIPAGDPAEPDAVVLLGYEAREGIPDDFAAELASLCQPLALLYKSPGWLNGEKDDHREQLEHSQKMEALGSMAGMIAHDFNNLLTTILGYTSILKNKGSFEGDDREFLDQVEEAAHRAADLTARLLAFARGGIMRTGPLDLRAVISDTMRLAQPALQNRVELSDELPDEAVPVEGDEGQLQQALLNILLNARDAMPDGGHVHLALELDGKRGHITIRDDGPGMDAATRDRIFDPFFTTKPKGSGTGLGMSITYGILKSHAGTITVDSAPGKGTAFHIYLPSLASEPPTTAALLSTAADHDLVLVVDDDDMVRRTTTATVAHLGYNVVEAPSGRVAVELLEARPDRFAVVLLDLVMPELTGAQTFKLLRAIRPDLSVIVCTGYAADAHLDDDVRHQISGILNKPFTPDRLANTLSELGVRKARER
ncbi:MAG: ATP-binding protein [Dehalococcoidia bacterium]|nr:ATP-binding protein [Dehalococcoidia bacterium]